jgi:hypothetical protein
VAQEVVHSLPKAALPAHGLKVDSSAVPLVALLEQMTVNQLVGLQLYLVVLFLIAGLTSLCAVSQVSDKQVITVRENAQLKDVIEYGVLLCN